jgi:methylmalonyl-CoA mutase N-terminal domain/subunit
MYKSRPWTIRQYAGFGTPSSTNVRFKNLIDSGVTGLSVAFDLPTQMGLDPDNELAIDEVGRVGVSISCLNDMRTLFHGIDLEQVSVSMTINATAPIILLMYQIIAEERGFDPKKLKGTIQNDILKEFIARGTYVFPPEFSMSLFAQTFSYCMRELPSWNPISISGYHMAEAGADATDELAFTFANALEYAKWLQALDLPSNEFLERFTFFFAARLNLLQEVAKFRAAREIWAKLITSRFGNCSDKSLKLRFHSQTAGSELQIQSPELNIVRVTIQALASILGGTQSLHTNSFDEAFSLPSLYGAKIATATQQILIHETDLRDFVDPFEGSITIEAETEKLITMVLRKIDEIENLGGALKCLQSDYQKDSISKSAYQSSVNFENGEEITIQLDESRLGANLSNPEREKVEETVPKKTDEPRDSELVEEALKQLSIDVASGEDLMPKIKACLVTGATLGEIVKFMKFGLSDLEIVRISFEKP